VGESQNQPFQLSFNASLKVDFQGSRVTSDGGLILVRELDERLGFSELIEQHLSDSRGKNTQLPLADLLRQSVYSRAVVRFYNKRGTAEQWIKESKQAVKMTRLSCHRFRSNEVRLWLSVIAYNLGNHWRRLVLPKRIGNWSLTSLQQRLVKTGGRLIKHARYFWLLLAESHLTRRLFGSMRRRIAALPSPAG
jgi:Transposase DDE domain group 1